MLSLEETAPSSSHCPFSSQKWLSSPFPRPLLQPQWPRPPEISPLEVLDRDAKATQLFLLQQDKGSLSLAETSGHCTSCFTNQGYFFFHLPDALEIEACQVYFVYDPCTEELTRVGPAPEGALLPPLPTPPGDDDAYCTFPRRRPAALLSESP